MNDKELKRVGCCRGDLWHRIDGSLPIDVECHCGRSEGGKKVLYYNWKDENEHWEAQDG